jgi:hypothetical protein
MDYIGGWSERGNELKAQGFNEKSSDDVHKDFGQEY